MGINALVCDVRYPINLAEIIRTSHVLGGNGKLYFYDPGNVIRNNRKIIHRFSCNIDSFHEYKLIRNLESFLKEHEGRKVATDLSMNAKNLVDFKFKDNDLILFGNERTGLSREVIDLCDISVIIPMKGKPYGKKDYHPGTPIKGVGEYPTYKVSIAHSIVMYKALEQIGEFGDFDFGKYAGK